MEKIWYKSKVIWLSFIGFLTVVATTQLPVEYKEIIIAFESLIISTLTVYFRWGTDSTLKLK
jgi:hypothetical protein